MRRTRVWAGLLGLEGSIVEDVYCGDEGEVVVAVRPRFRERGRCGSAGVAARDSISGMDGVGGGRWISGRRSRISKRMRRGCPVAGMGWLSRRSRGPGTALGSHAALRTRSRGWRCIPRRRRLLICSGLLGGRSGGSLSGSATRVAASVICWVGCGGSGLMRSATAKGSAT